MSINIVVEQIDARLDLRGTRCPINFVKTKLKLEEMEAGEILELWIDDGEPMGNVPRSIKEEGHRIIKAEKLADGSFRLLVRKSGEY
ncbi:sulfurtransferase TusA family protein [Candidatus Poribacteria bacterium]|nr:sulfurtransferase TusA family protein [Candidatus Poribacteria bacterium]